MLAAAGACGSPAPPPPQPASASAASAARPIAAMRLMPAEHRSAARPRTRAGREDCASAQGPSVRPGGASLEVRIAAHAPFGGRPRRGQAAASARPAAGGTVPAMSPTAARTPAASHRFAYPVVRPALRPPAALIGATTTW